MTTLEITNFGGRLTRKKNGDINSGLAKFATSFGYDPFSKPGQLTWLYQPTDIANSVITDAVLDAKLWSFDTTARYVYGIGNSGNLYQVDPTASASTNTPLNDTSSVIGNIQSVAGATFSYGAELEFWNNKIVITADSGLPITTDFDGSNKAVMSSILGAGTYQAAISHPMVPFLGKLYIGNGSNIAEVSATNVLQTATRLNPGLPTGMYVRDLDITPDGNYLIITASLLYPPGITNPTSSDRGEMYAVDAYVFYWNGIDQTYTSTKRLPSYPATSLNSFLDKEYTFITDSFGVALLEGNNKLLTLPQSVAPMPNGVTPNGTFLTWVSPEASGTVSNASRAAANTYISLFYYGYLDSTDETPGLWRVMRQSPSASNKVWKTPLNMMVNNYFYSDGFASGWGKHYISAFEYNSNSQTNTYHFYRFVLPPSADTSPQLGVYETQNQLFSKRVSVKQIRVYTEPTVTNSGFQLDLIDNDGTVVTNGTFTYTYAAGTNINILQGSLERINFNPACKDLYSVGLRVTNTGTANSTINKIEIDWEYSGK